MKSVLNLRFALFAMALLAVAACNNDDEIPPVTTGDDPVASFQFAVSDDNFLEVAFSNFSQNADSYSWDFGDGNSSTEESPTHVYETAGDYTVTLTASGNGTTSEKSESISLTDPDGLLTLLAGTTSKTWILQREGIALGIGPSINDNAWWSFGGVTALGDRPCILDDEFTFHRDGTWEFSSNNTIFVDFQANGGWLDPDVEGCYDESATSLTSLNGDDLSAFGNGGDYTYEFDGPNNTLTLNGLGAYIGLANKTADGDNFIPISTKTYTIFNFVDGGVADSLQMAIVANDGSFSWNFYLVSYENAADTPDIPSSMPNASFNYTNDAFTYTFTNTSSNATTYSWDFGDGSTSTEDSPVHTYSAEGVYTVTLTASDDMGQMSTASQDVTVSAATFTPAALSLMTGKIWRLNGEGSYKVGDSPGSGAYWGGLDAAGVAERACQMDDEFIFFDDGSFKIDVKDQVWAEDYMGGAFACTNVSDLTAPFDVFGGGDFTFTADDNSVTVNGLGAYLGFNKPYNMGELPNDGSGTPQSTITYEVFDYSKAGNVEILALAINYDGAGNYWTITLRSEN